MSPGTNFHSPGFAQRLNRERRKGPCAEERVAGYVINSWICFRLSGGEVARTQHH